MRKINLSAQMIEVRLPPASWKREPGKNSINFAVGIMALWWWVWHDDIVP